MRWAWVPGLVLIPISACSTDSRRSGGDACIPGDSKACVCAGGLAGGQACKEDGSGFEECDCTARTDVIEHGDTGADPDADDTGDTTTDNDTGDTGTEETDTEETGTGDTDTQGTDTQDTDTQDTDTEGTGTEDTDDAPPPCETSADCPDDLPECTPQGTCVFCYPGTFECQGQQSMVCAGDGSGWALSQDCAQANTTCNAVGVCESPCGGGFGKLAWTNAGCEFWAVDLHNAVESLPAKYLDAQNAQFAVIASNTSEAISADVTLTRPDGGAQTLTLEPQTLTAFLVEPDWGLSGTQRGMNAFRLTSTAPIVAYQFNPFDNEDVFSNDASILLPVGETGTEFFVVTREHSKLGQKEFSGYVVVVGTQPGATSVTVEVTANTAAGDDIPALLAGASHTFDVALGEVVAMETTAGDLTGTRVTATAPVLVFGGHTAARTSTECCSDHIEHQLPPVSRWGKDFYLGRSVVRGGESDYLRVVASADGTNVTVAGTPVALQAGEFHEKTIDGHAAVTANKPVLVAQFLASSFEASSLNTLCNTAEDCGPAYTCQFACQLKTCTTDEECGQGHACDAPLDGTPGKECKPIGDPAMILAIPVEQWQKDFVFLTPDKYKLDYINVVGPDGVVVTLDGEAIPAGDWESVGDSNSVYRAEVSDGVHVLDATEPVSVTVYGYDSAVSYGYSGAMGLKSL